MSRERFRIEVAEVAFKLIGAALGKRLGLARDDLRVQALAAASLGALNTASRRWGDNDGADDLIELIDAAFAAIAEPFPVLGT